MLENTTAGWIIQYLCRKELRETEQKKPCKSMLKPQFSLRYKKSINIATQL